LAASLHDWDLLLPVLVNSGYEGYALDLLGHGESPKPDLRGYKVDWLFDHFLFWLETLKLRQHPVFIGHSLGGYLALEYAIRFPDKAIGLILVDPVYSMAQFPAFMRFIYHRPSLSGLIVNKTPEWLLRMVIDLSSFSLGHSVGGMHTLPIEIREQTVLDYTRTAPGVYNILNKELDLTPKLSSIKVPSLVVWGNHDRTLAPSSFAKLVATLPNATGKFIEAGHVPHQSDSVWFNQVVLEFLASLCH
jgi:pimeloyl-ACP methyl ester carboxylesterase